MSDLPDILKGFVFERVLSNDSRTKLVYVLGKYKEDECILSFEKVGFEDGTAATLAQSAKGFEDQVMNNIYGWALTNISENKLDTRVKVICPATETHILKYETQARIMYVETPSLYQQVTLPYIKSIPEKRIQWVKNILDGSAEAERVIHHDHDPETGFVILPDMKWDGHVETLYWVAITMRSDILSVRSLEGKHVGLLKKIRDTAYKLVKERTNLLPEQLRLFVHYQPSYYHFHVHITAVSFADAPGVVTGQAHLLDSVIDNLELYPDYYQRVTLPCVLGERHPLITAYNQSPSLSQ
jgi:m7GpppX diphosphatase